MTPDAGAVAAALRRLGLEPTTGPRLSASGWESHVFDCPTTTGRLAVRVHAGADPVPAQREFDIMRAVGEAGYPVPAVHGLVEVAGRAALVLDFVDGGTLADSGWSNRHIADTCLGLMHRLHAVPVVSSADPLAWLAAGANDLTGRMPRFAPFVGRLLADPPRETRAAYCHLDFHPGNVLWDGSPWVIDWTSGRVTDPRFDFAWTRLLSAMYDPEWLEWIPQDTDQVWFEAAMGLRRLTTVASMLATGAHAAGQLDLEPMRIPAEWLTRGTGLDIGDVEALLTG